MFLVKRPVGVAVPLFASNVPANSHRSAVTDSALNSIADSASTYPAFNTNGLDLLNNTSTQPTHVVTYNSSRCGGGSALSESGNFLYNLRSRTSYKDIISDSSPLHVEDNYSAISGKPLLRSSLSKGRKDKGKKKKGSWDETVHTDGKGTDEYTSCYNVSLVTCPCKLDQTSSIIKWIRCTHCS